MSSDAPRALIVEDDRSWQEILAEFFEDAGLQVDTAADISSAGALIKRYPHRLAVVDLSLEENDPHNKAGLHILEDLAMHDPACLRVLLTGFATVELAVSAIKDFGAYTCMSKESFNRSQFREIIKQALISPAAVLEKQTGPGVETRPAPAGAMEAPPSGRALVVDDDAGWRSILAEMLADAGYQPRLCSSYGEALGCLRREKFDLAVVDLSLAGERGAPSPAGPPLPAAEMEGYRLLTSTRALGLPTMVVSGIASPADIDRAYQEQGVFAYMEKQAFDRKAFARLLAEAKAASLARNELKVLTDRELEVLDLLARGKTNKEIADTLVISPNTVKRHLKAIFGKLGIHTRSAAAAKISGARLL